MWGPEEELHRAEGGNVATFKDGRERDAVFVEQAHVGPMMGFGVLEPIPSRNFPYELVDPFILVHEASMEVNEDLAGLDTKHPHRGFDNLWYLISGTASTGHTTGPGGSTERVQLQPGALLKIRTGRGVWHAESIGEDEVREGKDGSIFRGVLFWVNLARKDKHVDPTAQVLTPAEVPERREGDAIVRVLVGEGSPVELGTPGLILDVQLPDGGTFSNEVPAEFNGFVYFLGGEADVGSSKQHVGTPQTAVLGPGDTVTVQNAIPGTRFMLFAGKPYGEQPIYNGPYVD